MTESTADVVVLGLGPGGEDVAGRLAEAGLSVVAVEAELVGGECPYWGCIPSKMMIRAGNLLAEGRRIPGMSGAAEVHPDFTPVARRIRDEATDTWNDKVAVDRLAGKGARVVKERGRLVGPHDVQMGAEVVHADRGIVIATGTAPVIPAIDGLHGLPYWTNREAISTERVPDSLAVLGGGSIGLELAQMFARFGSAITVVEGADRLVAIEEPEASALLHDVLCREGLTVHTDAKVTRVRLDGERFALSVDGADDVTADRLLVATGRRARLDDLGLEHVGLDPSSHSIDVDEHQRAAHDVWAVGDVTGKGAFTHVAMYQSRIAVASILGEDGPPADYAALPRVTFTDPEVGAVGMTERQAKDAGIWVRTGTAQIPANARGWIHKAGNDGFIKVVEDADRGVLVGATSAGPVGGEALSGLAVAVRASVPVATLRHSIWAYPTFHRGISEAIEDLLS
ncbi:MAG: dihydrolipoyl dehydrogenase family protein [Nocardioidaceae bacterium]